MYEDPGAGRRSSLSMSGARRAWRGLAALALAGAGLVGPCEGRAASPVEGRWQTNDDGGWVELFACGDRLCGRAAGSARLAPGADPKDIHNPDPALRGRSLLGTVIMRDFVGGPVSWTRGTIYQPRTGATYDGSLRLLDDGRLKVTGCIAPLLCRAQVWTRVP
jgi:uncharacterized protein (DUF2147 family)